MEKFKSLCSPFYRDVHACILVYDITDEKSFLSLKNWRADFLNKGRPKDVDLFPFFLIGNKTD